LVRIFLRGYINVVDSVSLVYHELVRCTAKWGYPTLPYCVSWRQESAVTRSIMAPWGTIMRPGMQSIMAPWGTIMRTTGPRTCSMSHTYVRMRFSFAMVGRLIDKYANK
jgi:hypothetical protein